MDLKKDFSQSFSLLMRKKKIIYPSALATVVPIVMIFIFLAFSGLSPLLHDLNSLYKEYESLKVSYLQNPSNFKDSNYSLELLDYLGKESSRSTYSDGFLKFLSSKGYTWDKFRLLMTLNNSILLIICILIGFIVSFYFSCMSFAIISLGIKDGDFGLASVVEKTNHFIIRILIFKILYSLIIFIPIAMIAVAVFFLFKLNLILGVLSGIILILIYLIYVTIIILRLFFAVPIIYINDKSSIDSLKISYKVTKGHIGQVLAITVILTAIYFLMNSIASSPLYEMTISLALSDHTFSTIYNTGFLLFFVTLGAIIITFSNIFWFYTFIDISTAVDSVKVAVINNIKIPSTRIASDKSKSRLKQKNVSKKKTK